MKSYCAYSCCSTGKEEESELGKEAEEEVQAGSLNQSFATQNAKAKSTTTPAVMIEAVTHQGRPENAVQSNHNSTNKRQK